MKLILALASLLVSLGVHAETIMLEPSPCNVYRDCYDVANDQDGTSVAIYARLNTRPAVVVNGVAYTGTIFDVGGANIAQTVVTTSGAQAFLVVNFSHTTRLVNAGRARYYVHVWSITGGSITINGGSSAVAPVGNVPVPMGGGTDGTGRR